MIINYDIATWLFRGIGYKGELISHSLAHPLSQSRPDKVLKLSNDDDDVVLTMLMMILMIMNDDTTFWLWWCWLGEKAKNNI